MFTEIPSHRFEKRMTLSVVNTDTGRGEPGGQTAIVPPSTLPLSDALTASPRTPAQQQAQGTASHPGETMAKFSSRSRVIQLSKAQYRMFAEQTKAVGLALNVSTFKHMGCWGEYSPWALLICRDATADEPQWTEHALINIASAINADELRAQDPGRPEVDWSVLEDHEIYPFLVQHEIGHRQDNFDTWGIMMIKDLAVRDECHRWVRFVNEMLADRYAWNHIRPGEPLPMSEHGKAIQDKAAYGLTYLEKHAVKRGTCKPEWQLAPGAYSDVPAYMLASPKRAAYLGPRVNAKIVAEKSTYYGDKSKRRLF